MPNKPLNGTAYRRPLAWALAVEEMNDKMICYCKGVSEQTIVEAIRNGATSLKQIQDATGACTGNRCKELNPIGKCCSGDIMDLIERETGSRPSSQCCCK